MVLCVSIAQGMSVGEPEPIEERVERESDVCSLPKDVGNYCGFIGPGPSQRWFFNTPTGECEEFRYLACSGNGNNFESEEACLEACSIVTGCEDKCGPGLQRIDCSPNCTDKNECTSSDCNNCSSNAICMNTHGSYTCVCNDCFTGDGFTCSPKNSCDKCDMCHGPQNQCYQTGVPCGYGCRCGPGFQQNGQWGCKDKNECKQHPCHRNAHCQNCYGSYDCVCNPGYCGNGFDCHDIDECYFGQDNCDGNAYCDNYDGGFACRCYYNYVGTGIVGDCYENSGSSSSGSSGGHSGHRGHGGHSGHRFRHRFGRDADVEV